MCYIKKTAKILALFVVLLLIYPYGYFVLDTNPTGGRDYHGVGAYIINLECSRARYQHVKPNIEALGFPVRRISAIDGNNLSQKELVAKVDFAGYKELMGHLPKLGTIGCSLSHIKAWQTFLRSNFAYAIIFEDDVNFNPAKLRNVIEELRFYPKLWDLVSFGATHHGGPLVIKQLKNKQAMVIYLMEIACADAYMISRAAAMKLLTKALPIKTPIDQYFTRSWELDMRFVGVEPRLVTHDFGDSDIGRTKDSGVFHMSFFEAMQRGIYKLHSYIIRFFYNFKVYLAIKMAIFQES